jgi:ribosomal protein S12 methylthiotransferase
VADKVYFVSLGCPKNRVDTEVMLGSVDRAGYRIVDDPAQAGIIVVNTCGFIGPAMQESVDTILEMAQYKDTGVCEKLVVTGCLSQRHPEEVAAEMPEIDHVLGSGDFAELVDVLQRGKNGPRVRVSETPAYLYDHQAPRISAGPAFSAYVKIAEGCDRPCAFCIIPNLRGPQRSRQIESVVDEVYQLAVRGAVEINLIAQDLTRYGADLPGQPTLAQLLRNVARVPGIRWVRLHYTYPSAFTDELIDVIATEPAVAKYVDVPLQHIDDGMLKRMRRGHTARTSYELVERLRAAVPDIALRTTFIVGHPGETDESFAALTEFVREARFDHVGVFTYCREEGTVSALLPRRVSEQVAEARREQLMAVQREISRDKLAAMVGRELEVLVEGVSDESDLLLQGRWAGQAPEIDGCVYLADGSAPIGALVRARVTDHADYDLAASILGPA